MLEEDSYLSFIARYNLNRFSIALPGRFQSSGYFIIRHYTLGYIINIRPRVLNIKKEKKYE